MRLLRRVAVATAALLMGGGAALAQGDVPRNETLIVENPEGTIKNAGWFNIWAVNAGGRSTGLQQLAVDTLWYIDPDHGLDGAWYHMERSRLGSLPLPFVAHLAEAEGGHYVAVMALRDSVMVVVDPAVGALVGPADALLRRFSGRVFVLDGQS